jgi:hypothetical protein
LDLLLRALHLFRRRHLQPGNGVLGLEPAIDVVFALCGGEFQFGCIHAGLEAGQFG